MKIPVVSPILWLLLPAASKAAGLRNEIDANALRNSIDNYEDTGLVSATRSAMDEGKNDLQEWVNSVLYDERYNEDSESELSTLETDLSRLMETVDALASFFELTQRDDKTVPPLLANSIKVAAQTLNKTKAISMRVIEGVTNNQHLIGGGNADAAAEDRRLATQDATGPTIRRHHDFDSESGADPIDVEVGDYGDVFPSQANNTERNRTFHERPSSNPLHHALKKSKHAGHPRIKKHVRLHDAIARGDFSQVDAHFDRLVSGRRSGSFAASQQRRLQPAASAKTPKEEMQDSCIALVECVRTWTLYDTIVYFWYDDITEDGELANNTMNGEAQDIMAKAEEIRTTLSMFHQGADLHNTPDLMMKCNGLLRLFYRNAEKDGYVQNEPATWRQVCRSEGDTRFIQFSEIERTFGDAIADQVFEDAVICTNKLEGNGDKTFFDDKYAPIVPNGYNPDAKDKHGKIWDGANAFTYEKAGVLEGFEKFMGLPVGELRKGAGPVCSEAIDKFYHDAQAGFNPFFLTSSDKVFAQNSRAYYPFVTNCSPTSCYFSAQGYGHLCQNVQFPAATIAGIQGVTKHTVRTLFAAATDRDLGSKLVLGEKVSPGLLCAHTKPPGYCCLDLPTENRGPSSWGKEFQCGQTASSCINAAPVLAGFSKQTCEMYSGTYCPNDRDCQGLVDCAAQERVWAGNQTPPKQAYKAFIEESPEITDVHDAGQCGELREYLGFEADYPDDTEICEDLRYLRYNKEFDKLDAFAEKEAPADVTIAPKTYGIIPEADTAAPITAAPVTMDPLKIEPVKEKGSTAKTSTEVTNLYTELYQYEQVINTFQELFDASQTFECMADAVTAFVGYNVCNMARWVLKLLLLTALFVTNRVYQAVEYMYVKDYTISDWDVDKQYRLVIAMYENQAILQKNSEAQHRGSMDTMIAGLTTIGTQITDNSLSIVEQVQTLILDNTKASQEVLADQATQIQGAQNTQFASVETAVTDSKDELMTAIADTKSACSGPNARHLLEQQHLDIDAACTASSLAVKAPFCAGFRDDKGDNRVADKTFRSSEEAVSFLRHSLEVTDSCKTAFDVGLQLSVAEKTQKCKVKVEAVPVRAFDSTKKQAGQIQTFVMDVDEKPPTISCGFHSSPHQKLLLVGHGDEMVDTGFFYTIKDDCSKTLRVDISVRSNELEKATTAFMVMAREQQQEHPVLYVSASLCKNKAGFCVQDPMAKGIRYYEVEVVATDEAGWTATDTCHVFVNDDDGVTGRALEETVPSVSKRMFVLDSMSATAQNVQE